MKSKKLFIGAAVLTLTIASGSLTYAASSSGVTYQPEISLETENTEDVFSFEDMDKNNLPEGIIYQESISSDSDAGFTFDLTGENQ